MEQITYPVGTPMDDVDRSGPNVGGSEAPVIALGNVYGTTPASLFLDKLGRGTPFTGNKHTRLGTLLEPYIREWLAVWLGQKIEEVPPWVPHSERQWMRASLDGWVLPSNGNRGAVIEIKCTGRPEDWGEHWSGAEGIPRRVQIQCQHNAEVYDADRMIVCMADTTGLADRIDTNLEPSFLRQLVSVLDKRVYELWRDRPFIDDLVEAEEVFVECVRTETPPETLSHDDVKLLYPKGEVGTVVEFDDEAMGLVKAFAKAKQDKKNADSWEKGLAAKLGKLMKGSSIATYKDKDVLRWKNDKGLDIDSLKDAYPGLYASYCTKFDSAQFKEENPDERDRFMAEGIGTRKMTIVKGAV